MEEYPSVQNSWITIKACVAVFCCFVCWAIVRRRSERAQRRRYERENDIVPFYNPYTTAQYLDYFIGFIKGIHSLEEIGFVKRYKERVRPKLETIGGIFRFLNRLDAVLQWITRGRLVVLPIRWREVNGILDKLVDAAPGDSTKEGVRLYLRALSEPSACGTLSATGRLTLQQHLINTLHLRRHVQNYVARHPHIRELAVEKPLFIIGPPRTASTFLLKLLSQDPALRCPKFWELSNPTPPVKKEDYEGHERGAIAEKGLGTFEVIMPNWLEDTRKFHHIGGDEPEEDSLILMLGWCLPMHFHHVPVGSPYWDWMFNEDGKDYLYELHKEFLQLISSEHPPELCWLLKAPLHSLYPEALLRRYPDARIIITARDDVEATISWTKFVCSFCNHAMCRPGLDAKIVAEQTMVMMEEMNRRVARTRAAARRPQQFFDMEFEALCADPMASVRAIYSQFGMELSREACDRMQAWLAENPQNKKHRAKGKAKHSPESFGLTAADIRARCQRAREEGAASGSTE